jgi:hypothetical protein
VDNFVTAENSTNASEGHMFLLSLYSQVLDKKGKTQKAFTAIKECYEQSPRKGTDLIAQYYYLISKTGRYQEALPKMEKLR